MPTTRRRRAPPSPSLRFVVQQHWARSLHYDFRLEVGGRLVSWAVPKGPSRDTRVRRLCVRMPDHPLEYALFEGTIPEGEYGAGLVLIWDTGSYEPLRPTNVAVGDWLDRGYLKFILHGTKLQGLWEMVRYRPSTMAKETWLLVKIHDRHAQPGYEIESEPLSAVSGRSREAIAESEGVRVLSRHERPLEAWGLPCAQAQFEHEEAETATAVTPDAPVGQRDD